MPKAQKASAEDMAQYDVSDIQLPDQEGDRVPVYDTCDDIRTKINAHLRNTPMTQAGLCRRLGSMYTYPRAVQSKQLADFQRKKGPFSGNTSSVYYGAYVYFEKLRLKNNGSKSKKRLELEKIHPGGIDTTRVRNRAWCIDGEVPVEDKYGRLSFATSVSKPRARRIAV